jgi:hypothetical protein
MAMVMNSYTYRSRLENDVKKYPGLKSWVWGNDAYLACPYIDEIESLENMVGYYCKEWANGESDEACSSEDDFDDSSYSDDSMFSSTRQKLRSLARSNYNKRSVTADKARFKTSTSRPTATFSPDNKTNFLSKRPGPGSIPITHTASSNGMGRDPTPDLKMLFTLPTVNQDENINDSDIEVVGIEENPVKFPNRCFLKRPLSDISPNKSPYKRHNCTQGASKDNPIDLL